MPPEPWEKLIFPSPKSLKGVQKLLFLAKSLCIMPKYGCIQIPWWPAVLDSKLLFPFWRMTIAKELHPCMCESASSPNVVFRKISLLPSRWTQRRRSQCQVAAQNPADSASASVTPLSPGPGPGPGNDDKLPVSNQICPLLLSIS